MHAQTVDTNYLDGVIYVKVKDTSTLDLVLSNPVFANLVSNYNIGNWTKRFQNLGTRFNGLYRVEFAQFASIDALLTDFNNLSWIDWAEKAPIFYTNQLPDDYDVGEQWYLEQVDAETAWELGNGSSDVVIAIIDNAVSNTHDDLQANVYTNNAELNGLSMIDDDLNGFVDDINGVDVADDDGNPNPPDTISTSSPWVHGTHCAGIAAAVTNNNFGIAAVSRNVRYMPIKAEYDNSSSGGRAISESYEGINYAIEQGADVISMSFGSFQGPFRTMQRLFDAANDRGIVCIAAAGNN
jgi:subtilisin family serine protease